MFFPFQRILKNIIILLLINSTWIKIHISAFDENILGEDKEWSGLSWKNLSVLKSDNEKRNYILHPSSGHVGNGHMCGIIGPSGAGKSSLLSALSGTTLKTSNLEVYGSAWVEEKNNETGKVESLSLSIGNGEIALLMQDSPFFTMLTPREILSFAAFLQLPMDHSAREKLVDRTIESLGLSNIQHNFIGDRHRGSGISGGEKRRLAVGVELVTRPKIFLADEPTTGLDSFQADKVIRLMKDLVKERNIPCMCVLHQPRASIWKQLDSFVLLAPGGKMCYMGPRESAVEYFGQLGFECPQETNPAEYFIDLVSVDTEDPLKGALDLVRIERLHAEFMKSNSHVNERAAVSTRVGSKSLKKIRHVGMFRRLGALLGRAWRQNIRDTRQNVMRFIASVGQALLYSQIFKSVQKGPLLAKSVADRTAMLSFGAISMSMMALTKALHLFGGEKPIVNRERLRRQYLGFEYLISKVVAEIPLDSLFSIVFVFVLKYATGLRCSLSCLIQSFSMITVGAASLGFAIGSFSQDRESALAAGIPIMVIFMSVGIINPAGVDLNEPPPKVVRLLKQASPIKWAIEALCISEFKGMEFDKTKFGRLWGLPKMGAFAMVENGDQVLGAIGLRGKRYMSIIKNLAVLSGLNLCVALIGLIHSRSNSVEPKEPKDYFEADSKHEDVVDTIIDLKPGNITINEFSSSNEIQNPLKPQLLKGTML